MAVAQDGYGGDATGLESDFRSSVDRTLSLVATWPLSHVEVYPRIRRALLARFPYALFYLCEEDRVVVLACGHGRRNPTTVRSLLDKRSN